MRFMPFIHFLFKNHFLCSQKSIDICSNRILLLILLCFKRSLQYTCTYTHILYALTGFEMRKTSI